MNFSTPLAAARYVASMLHRVTSALGLVVSEPFSVYPDCQAAAKAGCLNCSMILQAVEEFKPGWTENHGQERRDRIYHLASAF